MESRVFALTECINRELAKRAPLPATDTLSLAV